MHQREHSLIYGHAFANINTCSNTHQRLTTSDGFVSITWLDYPLISRTR